MENYKKWIIAAIIAGIFSVILDAALDETGTKAKIQDLTRDLVDTFSLDDGDGTGAGDTVEVTEETDGSTFGLGLFGN